MQLDHRPGPAVPLDDAQVDALIGAVLDDWQGGMRRPSPPPWLMAAAVALCAALPLSAAAVWMAYEAREAATRPPAPPAAAAPAHIPSVAPTPAPAELEFETEELDAIARPHPRRTPSADELLAEASRLRNGRRWAAAAAAYGRVIQVAPRSPAAYVASVAQADILLEHLGRPADAARLYRRALSHNPGGALEIEAQNGLRRALR